MSLLDHSAPGQAAAYALQFDAALDYLCRGDSQAVGIETLDDVAMRSSEELVLGQVKSSVTSANLLADGAVGLWKTLAIWAEAIKNGEVSAEKTSFQLLFTGELQPGLVVDLDRASEPREIEACIARLRGQPKEPAATVRPYVTKVRAHTDDLLRTLIPRIRVVGGQTTAGLHKRIAAHLLLPADVNGNDVVSDLIGWIKATVHRAWEAGQPGWIRQDEFNNRVHATVARHHRRRVRELPARELVCDEAAVGRHRAECFVRQLEIIDADPQMLEDAILDFIRHNRERLRLTREGDTDDSDWADFDDRLVDYWKPVFRANAQNGAAQRRAGRKTYTDVQNHREQLAGDPTTELYLTRGAFHRLANVIRVGWHPRCGERCRHLVTKS